MRYDKPGWKAFNVAVVTAVLAFPIWVSWKGMGLVGLMLCVPLAGWLISRVVVHGGFSLFSWFSTSSIGSWHGTHYEFDNQKIRVEEHHERLLFVAEDVLRATGIATSPRSWLAVHAEETTEIPGRRIAAFGMGQLERLANAYPGTGAGRLWMWAQREVEGPWKKRRA